jgi:hypothetical protein
MWKPIPGFSGYETSNKGNVRSYRISGPGNRRRSSPRILKASPIQRYRRVMLRGDDGKRHLKKVASLVLLAFVGPPPEGQECCHNDGCSTNDALDNLRYDSHAANMEETRGLPRRTRHKRKQRYRKEATKPDEAKPKKCSVCKLIRPLWEFNRRALSSDGHRSECYVCQSRARQKYYARITNRREDQT